MLSTSPLNCRWNIGSMSVNQKVGNICICASFWNKLQKRENKTEATSSSFGLLLVLMHGSLLVLRTRQQTRGRGCFSEGVLCLEGEVGLVSLFNGISTLFRLFNAKAILLEEQYYLTHSWEDKGVHTFPKDICPKVNIIAGLENELVYYDSAVHRFNHYTTRTPPWRRRNCITIGSKNWQKGGFKWCSMMASTMLGCFCYNFKNKTNNHQNIAKLYSPKYFEVSTATFVDHKIPFNF